MVVNHVIINKSTLVLWFNRLEGHDWTEMDVENIFNFGDHQDVPRAITLLCLVADLQDIDDSDLDPSEMHTFRSLRLLGKLFANLVEPFILFELSLFQQIKHLIKFAYLAFALYLKNGSSFMTPQLYGDLQAMIKNAIFVVAHTKNLDPLRKVLARLLGDDVIEVLFGRSRMKGGHDPNCDILQLVQRLESALRLDDIFSKYPELERHARRLMLHRMKSSDSNAPRHFTGDLTAGSCNLSQAFTEAEKEVLEDLSNAHFELEPGTKFNFQKYFKQRDCDLQRPLNGKYPGLSKEADRSISQAAEAVVSSTPNSDFSAELGAAVKVLRIDVESMLQDEKRKEKLQEQSLLSQQPITTTSNQPPCTGVSDKPLDSANASKPSPFFYLDPNDKSKRLAKQTALREKMNPGFDLASGSSHDRLLRVRYFADTKDWQTKAVKSTLDGKNSFMVGSLFATLVYITGHELVCLAILHCTAIRGVAACTHAPIDEISLPQSKYNLSGQILELRSNLEDSNLHWDWTSSSIELETGKKVNQKKSSDDQKPMLNRNLRVEVNGSLTIPIHNNIADSISVEELPEEQQLQYGLVHNTWRFKDADLSQWYNDLSKRVQKDTGLAGLMPVHHIRGGVFPYAVSDSKHDTICYASKDLPKPPLPSANEHKQCPVCKKSVKSADLYNHTAKHILQKRRGLPNTADYPVCHIFFICNI